MTIGYNRLGSNGRFANQMFQYAGLRGVAAHRGYDFKVPPPDNYGRSDYALFECFEMGSVKPENFGFVDGGSVATGQFHFYQKFFDNCPDNVNLHDYFQTEKYFKNIEDTIRSDFTFKQEVVDTCMDFFSTLDGDKIFMHVRRGDYVNHPDQHPALPVSYYEEAYKNFDEPTVLVFSDDTEWCKQQPLFEGDRFLVCEGGGPYTDLYMMSKCDDFIIANSTFSWWGAWLSHNKEKVVIYPDRWFGPNNIDKSTADLFPPEWRMINEH